MNTEIIYRTNDDDELKHKTKRQHDLKLRILSYIDEPLQVKGNCWTTCCLCCTDLVEPLSNEERVIKLIIGYIRKYTRYYPEKHVLLLCIYYVGDASAFDDKQLLSNTESRREEWSQRKQCPKQFSKDCKTWCINCIGADRIERHRKEWRDCKERCYLCIACWLILYFLLKDVVLAIMISVNDCDAATEGASTYVSFDVIIWIRIATVMHSVYVVLVCCSSCYVEVAVCLLCVFWFFFVAWIVIGILFYSETSGSETCGSMILSWCILQTILQTIENFLTACCVCSIFAMAG
eukprot:547882_1